MLSHFSHIRLCDPVDCSPSGYSVHGILQVRTLEWIAMLSPGGSSRPRDQTCISYVSCVAGNFFTASTTWEVQIIGSIRFGSVTQLCPTLCDPIDNSPSGSSVQGILQAMEWVAISYSRGSSRPRDRTCISCIGRRILYHCTTWETLRICINVNHFILHLCIIS